MRVGLPTPVRPPVWSRRFLPEFRSRAGSSLSLRAVAGAAAILSGSWLSAAGDTISAFTLRPPVGVTDGRLTARIQASVSPTDLVVEDSSDGTAWRRVSTVLKPSAGALDWSHVQSAPFPAVIPPLHTSSGGNYFTRRLYRLRQLPPADPVPSGGNMGVAPFGRLVRETATRFKLTTVAGWVLVAEGSVCTITSPDGLSRFEIWGTGGHENLNGNHLKDWVSERRTILLPGDTIVTASLGRQNAADPLTLQTLSLYDGEQSHRLDLQTNIVSLSAPLRRAGEAAEADGETCRIWDTGAGVMVENIYTETSPNTGQPIPQAEVPLGRSYGNAFPNRVDDFYDDPRLGHT